MSSSIQLSDLSGALSRLKEAHAVDMDAVGDDQEEELESYLSSLEINDKLGADAVASRLALACGGVGAEEVTEESEHCVDSESPALESKPPRIVPKGESQSSSLAKIHDNLKEASKNIVTNNTLKEYARLWKSFVEFAIRLGFIASLKELEKDPTYHHLPEDLPAWVSVWIMDK
ncbi:hypothetical protein OH76DRAFT_1490091 [Lentinus brumalis]|uniref:Uncharacterized protein n=1 Tax=Lentinus brumalis TaxID=2498619 RepID=A0A371CK84_9APHY|nr:hypothetical protein OH76DRAFT_1490292 [Polyporus brumalis]RDX40685.1 hypothetical protein OH76DRAFT_1490091 [Polyporus brumalis]